MSSLQAEQSNFHAQERPVGSNWKWCASWEDFFSPGTKQNLTEILLLSVLIFLKYCQESIPSFFSLIFSWKFRSINCSEITNEISILKSVLIDSSLTKRLYNIFFKRHSCMQMHLQTTLNAEFNGSVAEWKHYIPVRYEQGNVGQTSGYISMISKLIFPF